MQAVRIIKLTCECTGRHPDYRMHQYLKLTILGVGADVYDLEAYLECDHSYRANGRTHNIIREFKFTPLTDFPNPFKNGQVATLELGDHDCRDLKERHYADTRVPSQILPWRVRLAIYHSGRRLLVVRRSWRFWRLLRQYDSLCRHPTHETNNAANKGLEGTGDPRPARQSPQP